MCYNLCRSTLVSEKKGTRPKGGLTTERKWVLYGGHYCVFKYVVLHLKISSEPSHVSAVFRHHQ